MVYVVCPPQIGGNRLDPVADLRQSFELIRISEPLLKSSQLSGVGNFFLTHTFLYIGMAFAEVRAMDALIQVKGQFTPALFLAVPAFPRCISARAFENGLSVRTELEVSKDVLGCSS